MYGVTSGLSSVLSATLEILSFVRISVALSFSLGKVAVIPTSLAEEFSNLCAIPE